MPRFDGAVYDPDQDDARLNLQLERVRSLMLDGVWRTLEEISAITGDPQASISAQLRHLRKERFGSYVVEKQPRGERSQGLWEYRVLPPAREDQAEQAHQREQERLRRLTQIEVETALLGLRILVRRARAAGISVDPAVIRLGLYLRARSKRH